MLSSHPHRGALGKMTTNNDIEQLELWIGGETHPSDNPGRMVMSVREPLGVVGSITPFNVPFPKAAKLSAGALTTGNTVVGLASEFTPKSVLLMGRVYEEAGSPPGTFNAITGFGDSLTTHPLVKAILFTGSSAVGKHISALGNMLEDPGVASVLADEGVSFEL